MLYRTLLNCFSPKVSLIGGVNYEEDLSRVLKMDFGYDLRVGNGRFFSTRASRDPEYFPKELEKHRFRCSLK